MVPAAELCRAKLGFDGASDCRWHDRGDGDDRSGHPPLHGRMVIMRAVLLALCLFRDRLVPSGQTPMAQFGYARGREQLTIFGVPMVVLVRTEGGGGYRSDHDGADVVVLFGRTIGAVEVFASNAIYSPRIGRMRPE